MRLKLKLEPLLLSTITPITEMICPYGHLAVKREGKPEDIRWMLGAEIDRMRVSGEWRASFDRERERSKKVGVENSPQ